MKKFFLAVLLIIAGVVTYYYFPESSIPGDKIVDRIIVLKKDHVMEVYAGDELLKKYSISHAKQKGEKDEFDELTEDKSTPAGDYFIFDKDNRSKYHKSIGFASERYDSLAETNSKKKKKTAYRIHGMKRGYAFIGKFHRWTDWTKGGIALTDEEIDDLFTHVDLGVSVVVKD